MSGTSMDGVDAGLLLASSDFVLERGITYPLPRELHGRLLRLVEHPTHVSLDEIGQLDTALGICFSAAVAELLRQCDLNATDITAIGSHGQTIRHGPSAAYPYSMQVADANVIAAKTGITTVADFRRRDIALGGHGAPLAPAFHQAIFSHPEEERVVVNIGGMSNITALHADGTVSGHDTGPGNVLMDAWAQQHHNQPFDDKGKWARQAVISRELLQLLKSEEFFGRPPPKSTGRELFNLSWLTGHLLSMDAAPDPADVQTTLCELTASSIAESIHDYAPGATRCLVCGGGARNDFLMERLAALLPQCVVESSEQHGIAPEWVEAAAFAWLAMQTLTGRAGNVPDVTGASKQAILGAIYSAG